ncbi:MAG: hypothetical protein PHU98_06575 [Mariniphaga sp.]|nr:hypothetical protein [Mariniphaga sp.]
MGTKINKIIDTIKMDKFKNDKRIIIFAVCLFIAIVLWFLNALEKNYTTNLSYSVKYVNPPDKLFLANTPPDKFDLQIEAHGFTLLRYKLTFPFTPLKIDLSDLNQSMESKENPISIPGDYLIRQISNQVSKEISIIDISPKTISLFFDSLKTRMVPVIPRVTLGFKPQFNLRGLLSVEPESLKISGPASIIDTIQFLYTDPEVFQNLDRETEKMVLVHTPSNTHISEEKVRLLLPVEKFTEKAVTVPVVLLNKPENTKIKLFPPQVTVSFMVGLSDYGKLSAGDFTAAVSYDQIVAGNTTLDVYIDSKPPFIQSLKTSPGSVEYLIESE